MATPNPPAPINAAIAVTDNVITTMFRTPARITPSAKGAMKLSGKNALFSLKEHVDKPVVVRIWMEGTDPACTDELQQADYEIRLRFTGETEEENQSAQSE